VPGNIASFTQVTIRATRMRPSCPASSGPGAELVLDDATDPDHRHQHVVVQPQLVVRASTRG
jgi:DNA-binding LacI/PurR family transcriptional regulator